MSFDWQRFPIWRDVTREQFEDTSWQDKNSIIRVAQLQDALRGLISDDLLSDMKSGIEQAGMSIRLNPYIMSIIDWSRAETDPVRRQFLPIASELESDHPCLVVDSLQESSQSPVQGLVHRYPDKALFLVTSVCPVYCQYCTRSYAVGMDTQLIQKEHVASAKNWAAALDYIRAHPQIEDIVVSGGDISRLKAANVSELGNALLDIPNVRRIRLATKAVSVQPMKFLTDEAWTGAVLGLVDRGRSLFKDVCIHTHFNHAQEVTPLVEKAMRRLHADGVVVRNQTVLLRGVNDDAGALRTLFKTLGAINIHPYYVYLCDMVKGTEHFRVSLTTAQQLEKQVRGATAGFNTPLFIVDTPAGKRDVHSAEFHDRRFGVSAFISPIVAPGRTFHYFDPLRTLAPSGVRTWRERAPNDLIADVLSAALEQGRPQRRRTDPQAPAIVAGAERRLS